MHRWTALASFAALRAHACSLLELPIEGPGDPTDGLEVPLGEPLIYKVVQNGIAMCACARCLTKDCIRRSNRILSG